MTVSLPNTSPGRAKAFLVLLGSLVVGIIGPIIATSYTERTAVELQLLSQSSLVDRANEIEKLQVSYDKRVVSGLSRVELALVNTGRRSIRSADVTSAITVTIDTGRILDVRTDLLTPPNLQVDYQIDPSGRFVTMGSPLLNSGDRIRFTLLVDRTPPPQVSASARIAGLHDITQTDRRREVRSIWRVLPWSFYPVSLATAVSLILLIFFSYAGGYVHRTRYIWRFRDVLLGARPTPEQYARALHLTFDSDPRLEPKVRQILDSMPPGKPIAPEPIEVLNRTVERHIRDARVSSYWIMFTLLVLVLIGSVYLWYVVVASARGVGG